MGDPVRQWPHFFFSINRNKRSLTVDLKTGEGREILQRIAKRCDVLTEGFRPGVTQRLGIDYETLKGLNRKLIYCSISGYGQQGPYRDLPGHDLNYQAMSGILQFFKDDEGNFVTPGVDLGDICSAMFAAIGIMAALIGREKTGEGQYIDVSMFDGLISWLSPYFGTFWGTGSLDKGSDPGYGIFKSKDKKEFALGVAHEDWFWDRLCEKLGLEKLKGTRGVERRARKKELSKVLQEAFREMRISECLRVLREADVPASPIQGLKEVTEDPQVRARELIFDMRLPSGEVIKEIGLPIKFSHMEKSMRLPPPALGEHNADILLSLGYSRGDIDYLTKRGII